MSKEWKSECEEAAVTLSLTLLEAVGKDTLLQLLKVLSQSLLQAARSCWATSASVNTRLVEQSRLDLCAYVLTYVLDIYLQ